MNCRQGDLAVVIRDCVAIPCPTCGDRCHAVRAGTLVVCAEHSTSEPMRWVLEEPLPVRIQFSCGFTVLGRCAELGDSLLRPIRDPGDEAVDEMVRGVSCERTRTGEVAA